MMMIIIIIVTTWKRVANYIRLGEFVELTADTPPYSNSGSAVLEVSKVSLQMLHLHMILEGAVCS
jgi:hypothetical protein